MVKVCSPFRSARAPKSRWQGESIKSLISFYWRKVYFLVIRARTVEGRQLCVGNGEKSRRINSKPFSAAHFCFSSMNFRAARAETWNAVFVVLTDDVSRLLENLSAFQELQRNVLESSAKSRSSSWLIVLVVDGVHRNWRIFPKKSDKWVYHHNWLHQRSDWRCHSMTTDERVLRTVFMARRWRIAKRQGHLGVSDWIQLDLHADACLYGPHNWKSRQTSFVDLGAGSV